MAPISPPWRLRISRLPARRPPGRPSVTAGREGGSWGRAEAAGSGRRLRRLLPPATVPPAARRRAGNLSGRSRRLLSSSWAPAQRRGRGPGAARSGGDACCPAPGAHPGRPPHLGPRPRGAAMVLGPSAPSYLFAQAGAPSKETPGESAPLRPRRAWSVSRHDRLLQLKGPRSLALTPGTGEGLGWDQALGHAVGPGHPVPLLVGRSRESGVMCVLLRVRVPTCG